MQELVPILMKVKFQTLLTLVVLLGLFLDKELQASLREKLLLPQMRAIFFLVIWMVLSVPFSVYPRGSFEFLAEHFWKVLVAVMLFLAYGSQRERFTAIVNAYLAGVFLICLFALKGTGSDSPLESYDANELGMLMVVAFPFVFWRIFAFQGLKRVLMAGFSVVILYVILESGSRGALVAIAGLALCIVFQVRSVKRGAFLPAVLVLSIAVGGFLAWGAPKYRDAAMSIVHYEDDYNFSSEAGRIKVWKRGLKFMLDNPVLGVGVNGFSTAEGLSHHSEGVKWSVAHNSFLQVGAELGFPGFLAFCFIICVSIRQLRKGIRAELARGDPDMNCLTTSYAMVDALIGFVLTGMFLSMAYSSLFFFQISLCCIFVGTGASSPEETPVQTEDGQNEATTEQA